MFSRFYPHLRGVRSSEGGAPRKRADLLPVLCPWTLLWV
nr:MAG TPA: hypothetical protein [Caudoviricetes sp.]